MKSIQLKEARKEDAAAILSYLKTVGGESHNLSFGAEGFPIDEQTEASMLQKTADHPINIMMVAWDGQEPVGLADLHLRLCHRCEIALSVRRDHWHMGIARALLTSLIDHAHATPQLSMIVLEVIDDNIRAIQLYESFGFRTVGHWHKFMKIDGMYYGAYLMELDLEEKEESN